MQQGIYGPNPDEPLSVPQPHSFIDSVLDGLHDIFLGRNDVPPPVDTGPEPMPVIDTRIAAPPYPTMQPEAPGRYQQEVFGVLLAAAGARTASFQTRTRCDFYTLTCYAAGAVAADSNDGVWVSLSPTPPAIPVLTAGQFQAVPFRLDPGETLNIHGAEQSFSVTLDSTIDLIVLVACNTNVPPPYV